MSYFGPSREFTYDQWVVVDKPLPHRLAIGLDLGKMSDYSALVVLEESRQREERQVRTKFGPDLPESIAHRYRKTYAVRNVHRYERGTNYLDIARSVSSVLEQLPRLEEVPELVVDSSGVGRPVVDILRSHGLNPVAVTITSGENYVEHSPYDFGVAKSLLVSSLDAVLADDRLSITGDSPTSGLLRGELAGFRARKRASGSTAFEADGRQGLHDDLVLAMAVALWRSEARPEKARFVQFRFMGR